MLLWLGKHPWPKRLEERPLEMSEVGWTSCGRQKLLSILHFWVWPQNCLLWLFLVFKGCSGIASSGEGCVSDGRWTYHHFAEIIRQASWVSIDETLICRSSTKPPSVITRLDFIKSHWRKSPVIDQKWWIAHIWRCSANFIFGLEAKFTFQCHLQGFCPRRIDVFLTSWGLPQSLVSHRFFIGLTSTLFVGEVNSLNLQYSVNLLLILFIYWGENTVYYWSDSEPSRFIPTQGFLSVIKWMGFWHVPPACQCWCLCYTRLCKFTRARVDATSRAKHPALMEWFDWWAPLQPHHELKIGECQLPILRAKVVIPRRCIPDSPGYFWPTYCIAISKRAKTRHSLYGHESTLLLPVIARRIPHEHTCLS